MRLCVVVCVECLLFVSQENVGGVGCDECKSGTFGLSPQNPSGCSPCFCFGVSSVCEEMSGLVRVPVSNDALMLIKLEVKRTLTADVLVMFYSDHSGFRSGSSACGVSE